MLLITIYLLGAIITPFIFFGKNGKIDNPSLDIIAIFLIAIFWPIALFAKILDKI